MKAVFVLALVFAVAFTVSEGAFLKNQALKTCNEKKIDKLIDKIVDDTYALKTDAYKAYKNAYSGMIECVITSFTDLVGCVEGVVEDNIGDLEDDLETYVSTVKKLANTIVADIEACI